jgi:hypothetical protein
VGKWVLWLAALTLAAGCLELTVGDPADSGAAAASAPPPDAARGAMTGSGCALDSASGVTLCTRIDACPGLVVDHDLYPDCGFRVPSLEIELLCVCGDSLCSAGTALRCADAAPLLADGSELVVCTQEAEGRCARRASR